MRPDHLVPLVVEDEAHLVGDVLDLLLHRVGRQVVNVELVLHADNENTRLDARERVLRVMPDVVH